MLCSFFSFFVLIFSYFWSPIQASDQNLEGQFRPVIGGSSLFVDPYERIETEERLPSVRGVVFDGGGVRGAYSIAVFHEICQQAFSCREGSEAVLPHNYFTHFGGTSTGSLIAFALTIPHHRKLAENGSPIGRFDDANSWLPGPYPTGEIKLLYRYLSSQIFSPNDLCADDRGCCGCIGMVLRAFNSMLSCCGKCRCLDCSCHNFNGLCGSKYSNAKLRHFLREYFGDFQMKDLLQDVTAVAIDVNGRIPIFFNRVDYPETLVRDVALASTAAQTFFSPVSIVTHPAEGRTVHCVDGGVVDNSPVTPVMIRMLKEGQKLKDFLLISIGTGENPRSDRISELLSAGLLKWAREIPAQGITASTHASIIHMRDFSELIGQNIESKARRFFRIQTSLTHEDSEMDNCERVPFLIQSGEAVATDIAGDNFRYVVQRMRGTVPTTEASHRRIVWNNPPPGST